ncbi:hypothetical protein ACFQO7_00260 [Catellatospora aurea]|uniref:Uncharacterized protein n=1 Tax=Catellatospora aurea TaxID=1337874 RepID=A0ABW2GRC5_9ACTN
MLSPSDGRTRPALALGVAALCAAALLQTGAAPTGLSDARPWPPPRPAVAQDATLDRPWPSPKPAEPGAQLSGLL